MFCFEMLFCLFRVQSRIRLEKSQEGCSFVKDTETRNTMFIIRISERAMQMQKDMCLYFIDYAKLFDKIQHKDLFKLPRKLDLFGKDNRIIQNILGSNCLHMDKK